MIPPRKRGKRFSTYQDAMEWWRDTISDEDEREEYEEDEMDEADRWYDEYQDEMASR